MNKELTPSDFNPVAEEELTQDLDEARLNMKMLIDTAMGGVSQYAQIADSQQHPRAYEVLFNAIRITADLNKDLADHAIKKNDRTSDTQKKLSNGDTVNQNLFVGSPADLLKIAQEIKDKKNE